MNISNLKTPIMLLISALWIILLVLAGTGHFVAGMVLSVPLMGLHFILGIAKKGVISKKFLIYPLLVWAILFIVSFILCGYYADAFAGVLPSFTVFGMHPSFAPVIIGYWLGGLLTISLGYYLLQDEWLSQKDWDEFCEEAKKIKEGK